MFRMQRWRVGKDRETRNREKQIIRRMGGAKLASRCRDRVEIALDQMFVEAGDVARSYFCFLPAVFGLETLFLVPATAVPLCAVDLSPAVPPSATERLSSMSMVCVSASSLFAAGGGATDGFGSLIVPVDDVDCASLLRDLQLPVSTVATHSITRKVCLTGTSTVTVQCKFPDRAFR
jgi:hypothetical protein